MSVPEKLLEFYSRTPVNRHFRFRLMSRSRESVAVSMEVLPDYIQEEGVVQGGIISAIADNAAVYAFVPDLVEGEGITSVEFKMNFLRPATMEGGLLEATSRVVHRGRRIGVSDVEVRQSGELIAKGTFTYLFVRSGE